MMYLDTDPTIRWIEFSKWEYWYLSSSIEEDELEDDDGGKEEEISTCETRLFIPNWDIYMDEKSKNQKRKSQQNKKNFVLNHKHI